MEKWKENYALVKKFLKRIYSLTKKMRASDSNGTRTNLGQVLDRVYPMYPRFHHPVLRTFRCICYRHTGSYWSSIPRSGGTLLELPIHGTTDHHSCRNMNLKYDTMFTPNIIFSWFAIVITLSSLLWRARFAVVINWIICVSQRKEVCKTAVCMHFSRDLPTTSHPQQDFLQWAIIHSGLLSQAPSSFHHSHSKSLPWSFVQAEIKLYVTYITEIFMVQYF